MSNDQRGEGPKFDLEERSAKFGEAVIAFAKRVPRNEVTSPLISQVVRAGTSIGGNYCEADEAETNKEFRIASASANAKRRKQSFRSA